MTISNETTMVQYAGDGTIAVFAYPFKIIEDNDLLVIVSNDTTGVKAILTLNSDYTVFGSGVDAGGTVVLSSGSLCDTGNTLTLLRNMAVKQGTDYVDGDSFSAESMEAALDRLTMICQQLTFAYQQLSLGVPVPGPAITVTLTGTTPVVITGSPKVLATLPVNISIPAATGSVNGYATASQITKLNGIEAAADVTDAANVVAAIHGVTDKNAPVDADEFGCVDSEALNVLKHITWANIKATLVTYFKTLFWDRRILCLYVFDGVTAITTGDGKAYVRIPAELNGYNIIGVSASLIAAKSTSGTPTVQIARGRQPNATTTHSFADVLSTRITIDANEWDSKDATAAAVINTNNDDLVTGDLLRVDIDVAGTGSQGLIVTIIAQAA